MVDLNRKLIDLFLLSDGLLLPDEVVLEEISKKQRSLRGWNEEIVLQGLITMKESLQYLTSQNKAGLVNSMDKMDWSLNEMPQNGLRKRNLNLPSVWELTRHLSNWMTVFIPPVRALDILGDMELIRCLESNDHLTSTLATIVLGHKDFNYLGSGGKFRELLNSRRQTILRLELCRLIYTRYHDPQILGKEVVPNLITTGDQYDAIMTSEVQGKRFLSYTRELVVWDIATKGEGPHKKWPSWWI